MLDLVYLNNAQSVKIVFNRIHKAHVFLGKQIL